MKTLFATLLIAFACVRIVFADDAQTKRMDLLLQEFEATNAPGMVVHVLQDGKNVYSKSVGMANLEYSVEISDNTVFDTASLAKQFTGYAVASLVKEGRLELDSPVNKYFPELGEPYTKITVRHLAHHTSGIRDIGQLYGLGGFSAPLTSTETLALIRRQTKLNFPLGSEHSYSNSNYVMLALIVEKITGQSFREWCADNIFTKLGMTSSFVNDDPKKVIKHRAVAYYGKSPEFSFDQNNGMSLIGSSAVYSSLADMQKWLKFLMTTSVKEGPTQLMLEPGKLDGGETTTYGLGLSVHPFRGTTMVEHSGSTPSGFRSQIAFFPKERFGFVVLSNWGDVEVIEQIGKNVVDIYLGDVLKANTVDGETPAPVSLSTEQLQRFVGEFLFDEESKVKIALSEDQLTFELEGRGKVNPVILSSSAIYIAEANAKVQFVDGAWDSAKIIEGGKENGSLKREASVDAVEPSYEPKLDLAGTYLNNEMDLLFSVEVTADGRVLLHKSATTTVELVHQSEELFRTAGWELNRVEFSRDESGRPNLLSIDGGGGCRDVRFLRLETP